MATDSARRLASTDATVPADFEDRLVDWALDAFPTRDELRNKLTLRFRVGVILLGSEMLREQRAAAEERRRIERAEADRRVERARADAEQRTAQPNRMAALEL